MARGQHHMRITELGRLKNTALRGEGSNILDLLKSYNHSKYCLLLPIAATGSLLLELED